MAKFNITIDTDKIKEKAVQAGNAISDKAVAVKDQAVATKDEIAEKIGQLDRMLEQSITEYNDAYTMMNDKGVKLFVERNRAVDSIAFAEDIVNSIANCPKEFDKYFEEIEVNKQSFVDTCQFADKELQIAREAAGGAGAGIAAGASVAFMAPTAAMWVATTFGTASTGAAISTLSGAAATNAALAWLGGGALTAGGGGMVAGNALLAMAGPVGWSIAGVSLLSSILLMSKKKKKVNEEKNEEIESIKQNTELIKEIDASIAQLLGDTISTKELVNKSVSGCMELSAKDYTSFTDAQKASLGALVNNTKTLSALLSQNVQ